MFDKGDIVVAKDEYLGKNELLGDTVGEVLFYSAETDKIILGVVESNQYSTIPSFSSSGCCSFSNSRGTVSIRNF